MSVHVALLQEGSCNLVVVSAPGGFSPKPQPSHVAK